MQLSQFKKYLPKYNIVSNIYNICTQQNFPQAHSSKICTRINFYFWIFKTKYLSSTPMARPKQYFWYEYLTIFIDLWTTLMCYGPLVTFNLTAIFTTVKLYKLIFIYFNLIKHSFTQLIYYESCRLTRVKTQSSYKL